MKLSILHEANPYEFIGKPSPQEMSRWISHWSKLLDPQQHLQDVIEAYRSGEYPELPGPAGTMMKGKWETTRYITALERWLQWPKVGMGFGI